MENNNNVLDSNYLVNNSEIEPQQIISLNKFIFLSLVSFGTYEIWWTYKAWRFFKQKEKADISPVARTIFSIIFLHSLLTKILSFAKEKGYQGKYSETAIFILIIICNALSRLPDPFWLISIIAFILYIPPFKALNYAKQHSTDFTVTEQTTLSGRQIALVVVGLIFWALVIIGLTMGN